MLLYFGNRPFLLRVDFGSAFNTTDLNKLFIMMHDHRFPADCTGSPSDVTACDLSWSLPLLSLYCAGFVQAAIDTLCSACKTKVVQSLVVIRDVTESHPLTTCSQNLCAPPIGTQVKH